MAKLVGLKKGTFKDQKGLYHDYHTIYVSDEINSNYGQGIAVKAYTLTKEVEVDDLHIGYEYNVSTVSNVYNGVVKTKCNGLYPID